MYQIGYTTDSFGSLPHIPTDTYDVIITDPPYDEHTQGNLCSGSLVGTKAVPKYDLDFQALSNDLRWVNELVRISKRWVVMFCSLEHFGLINHAVGGRKQYIRSCIWYKPNSMGQLTADRPANAYEGIALLHKHKAVYPKATRKRWNGHGSYGIWKCNGTRGKPDRHPNEKPVDLALKLVSLFSVIGETIFDPFCGSGAIGEAALRLGRHYAGWDNDRIWCDFAGERLSTVSFGCMQDSEAMKLCWMKGIES